VVGTYYLVIKLYDLIDEERLPVMCSPCHCL